MHRTFRRATRLAALASTGLTLSLLAGCSASAPKAVNSEHEKPAADDVSELTGTLTVSAAASLQVAFEDLAESFSEQHPEVEIASLSFDGSSVLATQIIAGAPTDVFASADESNMTKVEDAGLLAADPVRFATSNLQIAVAPGNPLGIETLADLARPSKNGVLPVVVTCAPEVPCGAAAQYLLKRDNVDLTAASEEQNVTAVLTKVAAGEADAGLVYRSDVLRSGGDVDGIDIDGSIEAAGTYVIAPIDGSRSPEAAQAFANFMLSDEAQLLFEELGFGRARTG